MRQIFWGLWLLSMVGSLPAQEPGKKYALLVGVETYDPSVFSRLEFSEDDVVALGKSLDKLGFTTIVMTRENLIPARRPATAKKIHDQLDGLLKLIKSEQDTLVVVMSGHGLQYKDDPLDADQTKESFFCPEEADPKDRASLVSIATFSQKVAKCQAGKKLLVVDACRNEVSAKGNKALEEELEPVGRRARTELAGMYSLFSCAPKEKSWEHPDLKHGVFISQMLIYLDGKANKSLYPRQTAAASHRWRPLPRAKRPSSSFVGSTKSRPPNWSEKERTGAWAPSVCRRSRASLGSLTVWECSST